MPDRRRRAGYREAALSEAIRNALAREVDAFAAIDDPLERVRRIGDFYAGLDVALEDIARVRLEAVRDLRARGWSYDRISAETGLSKGRVAQLAREAGSGGRRATH